MQTPIIRTEKLIKQFGGNRAVNGVSLDVASGTLHSIIGPNGAGKTTLFNLLTKDFPPTSGRIILYGEDITREPPHAVARRGVGRSYQITSVFQNMTLAQNVWVALYRRERQGFLNFWRHADLDASLREEATEILSRVRLDERTDRLASELSYGDQRLLEIAVTLATKPRVLLLDEPTAGLSHEETESVSRLIAALKGRYSILMIEHKMDVVMGVSDRVSVMHFGSMIAEGTPEEVARDPEVRKAYLGS
jgi:branched-chain amino acid transport system ATP-binding protein